MNKPQQSFLIEHGGELDEMMLGSLVKKMRDGSEAKRVVKASNGKEKMQAYKMGGWTHSGKK
jgi:hypothetical protein|tara:strand:- start:297 stop:482 length:186 start_codon:yes stop_codon:yes gene_type:complete